MKRKKASTRKEKRCLGQIFNIPKTGNTFISVRVLNIDYSVLIVYIFTYLLRDIKVIVIRTY